jgi:hypothetical protein
VTWIPAERVSRAELGSGMDRGVGIPGGCGSGAVLGSDMAQVAGTSGACIRVGLGSSVAQGAGIPVLCGSGAELASSAARVAWIMVVCGSGVGLGPRGRELGGAEQRLCRPTGQGVGRQAGGSFIDCGMEKPSTI